MNLKTFECSFYMIHSSIKVIVSRGSKRGTNAKRIIGYSDPTYNEDARTIHI